MNNIRGHFVAAPSKASPQTLCQKCLKRDNYECKAPAQERPYTSRPSRTQQLANPKLLPKLTSDVPNGLLQKDGIANAELAKKEAERGRKRKADDDDDMNNFNKRSRSTSSYSSDSINTISTNLSRSPSPKRMSHAHTGQSQLLSNLGIDRKRRHSGSTSASWTSESSHHEYQKAFSRDQVSLRHLRQANGQSKSDRPKEAETRPRLYSRSRSVTTDPSDERQRTRQHSTEHTKRRRRSSRSPVDRGRDRAVGDRIRSRQTRSSSESRNRGEVIRNRKSMTPSIVRLEDGSGPESRRSRVDRGDSYSRDNDRYGRSARAHDGTPGKAQQQPSAQVPRRERSLSPFSKRLALTQAMNMGR